MTKDVLITVSGIQFDVEEEPVELITTGTYYLKNGKHYVLYEEQPDDNGPVIRNRVKFWNDGFEMTKKGEVQSCLSFNRGEKTSNVYQTVMGMIQIDTNTHEFSVVETEDAIAVTIKYTLDINYSFISECEVHFEIQARHNS
ncbi:MAG: DUF1934 domain-containing protein [Bacteroidales bacterium]|nr:DUF1934 domain-containing protein [Clostridium sp.]MCM1204977.1 DUF1934 domain-containing protein [Bacteroidales bacterium]